MTSGDKEILGFMAKLLAFRPKTLADDLDYHDTLLTLLMILCPEQHWHYLQLPCFAAVRSKGSSIAHEVLSEFPAKETLVRTLTFNHRINEALHFQLFHDAPIEDTLFDPRSPARRWNLPRTDRWVDADTVREMFADLHRRTIALPRAWRIAWASRQIVRSSRALNNRLKDAALYKLQQHAGALNGMQWKRLTAPAPGRRAIHVRLHYSTGLLTRTIRIGDLVVTNRLIGPTILRDNLTEEEHAMADTHAFVRLLSVRVFELLLALREADPGQADTLLIPLLKAFYGLLLAPLFDRPDVAKAIAALGERRTLVVATHGALAQIPFAALHDGERHLLDRFDVVQAPPIHDTAEFAGGWLDVDAMTGGPPATDPLRLRVVADTSARAALPGARAELDAYRALFVNGAGEFTCVKDGEEWTDATVRWLLGARGVALLSAHVRPSLRGGRGLEVETPDGRALPVADALTEPIAADLVVLTGCGSVGQTDWLSGEEDSLVSICRRRGARAVIATLWPINDVAASRYNQALVAALTKGRSRAAAHGIAQREVRAGMLPDGAIGERLVRAGASIPPAAMPATAMDHPYFWAPFVLSGAWS